MNRAIIGAVVIVVGLGGLYFYKLKQGPTAPQTAEVTQGSNQAGQAPQEAPVDPYSNFSVPTTK